MASLPKSPVGPRPKRFALELPLEFRAPDSERWSPGKTHDISANGVLFRTKHDLPPKTPVDVMFQLPASLTGEGTVRLQCSGYVVRCTAPESPSQEAQVAVTFLDCHLANGKRGPVAELRQAHNLAMRKETGTLIHRMNTLLFIIMGNAELLSTRVNDPGVQELGARTMQAADEASAIVRSLAAVFLR